MCKKLKIISLLLCLLLVSSYPICYGQTITIQQTQYDSLKNLIADLKADLLLLKESTNLNITELQNYKQKLNLYENQLQAISIQLKLSQDENREIKQLLSEALQESNNLKALLTKLEKQISRLKAERNVGIGFGILGILLAIFH